MTTAQKKNYYEVLGVSSGASATEIKLAYRRLVRTCHPDVAGNNEEVILRFKEISLAYKVLSDNEKRKDYDALRGFYSYAQGETKQAQAKRAYKETYSKKTIDIDAKKILDEILQTLKSSGKTERKSPTPKRGSDITSDILINVTEALLGTTRTVNVLHSEVCPACRGRKFLNEAKCPKCNGLGEKSVHKKITVKIPQNVKEGSKIRIPNEGNAGSDGGKNGDLYLKIKIEKPSAFRYDDVNVMIAVPISPWEAVLGTDITIPAVNGKISMKVMPHTTNGQKYRLSSQGLTKNGKTGDMIVTIVIDVAKNLSNEEKELYEKLKTLQQSDIREKLFNESQNKRNF